jgi:hypothetical protein
MDCRGGWRPDTRRHVQRAWRLCCPRGSRSGDDDTRAPRCGPRRRIAGRTERRLRVVQRVLLSAFPCYPRAVRRPYARVAPIRPRGRSRHARTRRRRVSRIRSTTRGRWSPHRYRPGRRRRAAGWGRVGSARQGVRYCLAPDRDGGTRSPRDVATARSRRVAVLAVVPSSGLAGARGRRTALRLIACTEILIASLSAPGGPTVRSRPGL